MAEFDQALAEKDEVMAEAERCQRKLDMAQRRPLGGRASVHTCGWEGFLAVPVGSLQDGKGDWPYHAG